jgi:hypothetical protein
MKVKCRKIGIPFLCWYYVVFITKNTYCMITVLTL